MLTHLCCLQIVNSQFRFNAATRGGAIDSSGGATVSIINSDLSANHAHSTGGAVNLADAALTVLNTTFSANVAGAPYHAP